MSTVGPWRVRGEVVEGFKRGSKLLGTPTANISPSAFGDFIADADNGVYACWAQVGTPTGTNTVYKGVLSIGYNPQFKNKERTLEVYILHEYADDFYGELLGVVITAYLRPQESYPSMDDLITAIQNDIKQGGEILDTEPHCTYKDDDFFADGAPTTNTSATATATATAAAAVAATTDTSAAAAAAE
jgi:riboflavin kinase